MSTTLKLIIVAVVVVIMGAIGCGTYVGIYNSKVQASTMVNKKLSNLDEAYRRRADITENLVEAVKSEVGAESSLVTDYAQARASAGGQVRLTPEVMKDPQAMAAFKSSQASLGNVLSRLMVVAEKIPNPNFSRSYADLRVSLDGTNNRIGIAIKDYNDAVAENNILNQGFFSSMVAAAKFPEREFYKVEEEKKAVPQLKNMNMNFAKPVAKP